MQLNVPKDLGYWILRKLGVNEDQFESFILEVYENCFQRAGLTPENIASNLQSLIKLSKDIPVAKITEYIEEKKKEITGPSWCSDRRWKDNCYYAHRIFEFKGRTKDVWAINNREYSKIVQVVRGIKDKAVWICH